MEHALVDVRRWLAGILFPSHCLVCEAMGPWLCVACAAKLEPAQRIRAEDLGIVGARFVFASGPYHDPVLRACVHALKYQGVFAAEEAYRLLLERLPFCGAGYDAIVPLPAAPHRVLERGFDQAVLLVRWLSERSGAPCIEALVRRSGSEVAQATLEDEALRRANVAGAFWRRADVALGPRILLVDDVVTTGATVRAAVDALRADGAEIDVACLALGKG